MNGPPQQAPGRAQSSWEQIAINCFLGQGGGGATSFTSSGIGRGAGAEARDHPHLTGGGGCPQPPWRFQKRTGLWFHPYLELFFDDNEFFPDDGGSDEMDEANIRAAFEAKQIALEPPHVPISLWNLKGWTKPKEPEEGEERGSDANTDQIAGVAKSPEPENRSGSFAMTGRPTSGANQMTDRKNDGQQAKKFVEGGNQEEVKLIEQCRDTFDSCIFSPDGPVDLPKNLASSSSSSSSSWRVTKGSAGHQVTRKRNSAGGLKIAFDEWQPWRFDAGYSEKEPSVLGLRDSSTQLLHFWNEMSEILYQEQRDGSEIPILAGHPSLVMFDMNGSRSSKHLILQVEMEDDTEQQQENTEDKMKKAHAEENLAEEDDDCTRIAIFDDSAVVPLTSSGNEDEEIEESGHLLKKRLEEILSREDAVVKNQRVAVERVVSSSAGRGLEDTASFHRDSRRRGWSVIAPSRDSQPGPGQDLTSRKDTSLIFIPDGSIKWLARGAVACYAVPANILIDARGWSTGNHASNVSSLSVRTGTGAQQGPSITSAATSSTEISATEAERKADLQGALLERLQRAKAQRSLKRQLVGGGSVSSSGGGSSMNSSSATQTGRNLKRSCETEVLYEDLAQKRRKRYGAIYMDARVEEEADVKRKERADMLEKGRQLAEDPKAARERLFFGAPLGQFASKMAVDETAHAQHAHSEEMLQEDTNSTSEGAAATKRPLFVAASQQSQEIPLSNAWTQMTMEEKQRALNDLDTEGVMNEDGSYAGLGYTSGRRGLGYTGT